MAWSGTGSLLARPHSLAGAKLPAAQAPGVFNEAQTAVARQLNALVLRRADGALRNDARAGLRSAFRRMDDARSQFEAA